MNDSAIYDQTKRYLRGETSLSELHNWVSFHLPSLLRYEGSPEYELASLIEYRLAEYDIDGDEKELAKVLRRFLVKKKVTISP